MRRTPELLAPAGSFDAAVAAVDNGADAIYIGGTMLNARMNAKNFDDAELERVIKLCHSSGVYVYVTLNTAVYDKELDGALGYVGRLYTAGADALIVSDLGLASLIRSYYPDLPLHASTQASGHSPACAEALQKLGFCRMVCAREMTAEEIRALCAASPIEIEQFVHGALCVSQSGQCLASAMIGGRSGNRGLCAQPCRMRYNGSYPLSLKDVSLAGHIPSLIESGVASLKIEGRMKSPTYVGGVVRIYRRLLDEARPATPEEERELAQLFSRGGFTDGYYVGRLTGDMNGIRSEEDKSATAKKSADAARRGNSPENKSFHRIWIPHPPRAVPLAAGYTCARISAPKKPQKPVFTARFAYPEQIAEQSGFSVVYLPLERFEADMGANGVVLPATVFDRDLPRFERLLARARENGAVHALVCNVGHIELAERHGFILHGDYRLNIFNTPTAKLYTSMGLRDLLVSPELTLPQIRDIDAPKAAVVYGRIPLMLLTKPIGVKALRDRTGASFPVMREFGYDVLLNSVPFYMADKAKSLDTYGVRGRHLMFTTESRTECEEVIRAFESARPPKGDVRRLQT